MAQNENKPFSANFTGDYMIKQERKFSLISISLILALFMQVALQTIAFAQSDVGRITGTVRDQNNAVIQGATVTVKNEKTGEERTITTTEQGTYLASTLKPALYRIIVSATGFAKVE